MCKISDKLELLGICTEKAHAIFGDSIPDEYYRLLITDIDQVSDAGYDGLFVLAHSYLNNDENSSYNVGCRGFMGSSPVAYCCGLTQVDPLRCGDEIPVFPELFHGFYRSRRKLPFFLELGALPVNEIMKSAFYEELSQTDKRTLFFTDNLQMLDLFESEIGHKVESLLYDGSELCDYWLDALNAYDAKTFKKKVLNLFPDFLFMDSSGLDLFIRLLQQKTILNRRNLSRIFGILHSPGAIRNASHMLDIGVPFESTDSMDYIAYPEDIYGYLRKYLPESDAIQLSLQLCLNRKHPGFNTMDSLISKSIPINIVRRIWQIDHLYSSVQCYAHAGEFLRLAWYFENYYDEYIKWFCS
ncbi:MAG: hypothetical protein K6E53_03280 [Lachnospiraceae bacterium]|nr:hypothetical protein [Lachnospiraceae bacterium]